jgi:hypothetical protein
LLKISLFLKNSLALKLMNFTSFKTDITKFLNNGVSRARRIMDVAGEVEGKGV